MPRQYLGLAVKAVGAVGIVGNADWVHPVGLFILDECVLDAARHEECWRGAGASCDLVISGVARKKIDAGGNLRWSFIRVQIQKGDTLSQNRSTLAQTHCLYWPDKLN